MSILNLQKALGDSKLGNSAMYQVKQTPYAHPTNQPLKKAFKKWSKTILRDKCP